MCECFLTVVQSVLSLEGVA